MYSRQAIAVASRHAVRPTYRAAVARRSIFGWGKKSEEEPQQENKETPQRMIPFEEIRDHKDLLPPGAPLGTVPTDLNQSTGLERLELLGKMQGVDVFDMRQCDQTRKGTLDNPIPVKSGGDEQYVGCTGFPSDSHEPVWLTVKRIRPKARCPECGNVYAIDYIGPPDDPHAHHDPDAYEEPKTMAYFIKPEYYYK